MPLFQIYMLEFLLLVAGYLLPAFIVVIAGVREDEKERRKRLPEENKLKILLANFQERLKNSGKN